MYSRPVLAGPGQAHERTAALAIIGGLALPVVGLTRAVLPSDAKATIGCGSHADNGAQGGVNYSNSIDVTADPNCTGTRHLSYDYWGESSSLMDYMFIDFLRNWVCGNLAYNGNDEYAYSTTQFSLWTGWSISNSCGFQADQQIQFYKSGVVNARDVHQLVAPSNCVPAPTRMGKEV